MQSILESGVTLLRHVQTETKLYIECESCDAKFEYVDVEPSEVAQDALTDGWQEVVNDPHRVGRVLCPNCVARFQERRDLRRKNARSLALVLGANAEGLREYQIRKFVRLIRVHRRLKRMDLKTSDRAVSEMSGELRVSRRTVFRDIAQLRACYSALGATKFD